MNAVPAPSNRSDLPVGGASGPSRPGLLAPPGRPASLTARCLLVAANLASAAFFLLSYSRHGVGFGPYRIDLDVYRLGSRAWLGGANLYGALPPTSSGARLPFSYPPIAAVLLSPLALAPMAVAVTALTLATIALMALVLRMFLRSLVGPGAGSWWTIGWLLPAALFLEPVRNTLNYGQVNVALMALVAADCLVVGPRWPRGALVGVAAAVKLTPAAFALFFLLRRDWPAVRAAALSFAVSTGAGFLFDWPDSVRYWTSVVFQAARPGSPAYAANQSIQGVLARAGLDPYSPAGAVTWLVLAAVAIAVACLGMRRALAASADAWALSLNALAGLLISPISWSHHWVWGETAVLTLAILGWRGRTRDRRQDAAVHRGRTGRPHGAGPMPGRLWLAIAAAGAVTFALSPQWWFPSGGNRELHWTAWEQAVGSSYVIFAAVVLLAAACLPLPGMRLRSHSTRSPSPPRWAWSRGPADSDGASRPARKRSAAALIADRRAQPDGAEGLAGQCRPGPQVG